LISYPFGVVQYITAPVGLKPGSILSNGLDNYTLGSCLFIKDIPFNIKIYNIEASPNSGASFVRSAGM
jgi:large subunit ribosomal protein L2